MIETDVSARIRIEAAKHGVQLWRNNSGAFENAAGRWVRFGLGNDSPSVNRVLKSSDLIGILDGRRWGYIVDGLFCAIETKTEGWKYSGTDREVAQLNFLNLVKLRGGVACFATSWNEVEQEITRTLAQKFHSETCLALREETRL